MLKKRLSSPGLEDDGKEGGGTIGEAGHVKEDLGTLVLPLVTSHKVISERAQHNALFFFK